MTLLVGITLATFVSTFFGGLFALRLRDKLHLILGFSAGAVIGVAFFDLVPEAFALSRSAYSVGSVAATMALGFLLYLTLDRLLMLHHHSDDTDSHRGAVGAGSLSLHSLLDGMGIGLAFKVSPAVGIIVTVAVLAHDFSDGINTVNMVLTRGGTRRGAFRWLLVDALAPAVGILSTLFITISEPTLGLVLALFAGFFIYIGACDLVPESHHAHPTFWTTAMTIFGAAALFAVVRLATL